MCCTIFHYITLHYKLPTLACLFFEKYCLTSKTCPILVVLKTFSIAITESPKGVLSLLRVLWIAVSSWKKKKRKWNWVKGIAIIQCLKLNEDEFVNIHNFCAYLRVREIHWQINKDNLVCVIYTKLLQLLFVSLLMVLNWLIAAKSIDM